MSVTLGDGANDAQRARALARACALLVAIAVLLLSPRALAQAGDCDATNVMATARLVRWTETTNTTAFLTDGVVVPEGAIWTSQAIGLPTKESSLTFDLGSDVTIGAVYMQGDGDASFALLFSSDGKSWRRITFAPVPGGGMRSRSSTIDPTAARYIRFGEPSSGAASVTELELRCQLPDTLSLSVRERDPAPPTLLFADTWRSRVWLALTGVPVLAPTQATQLKLALAIIAAACIALRARRRVRVLDAILVAVAVASFAGYYNWGAYRFPDFAHEHELFHYVVGGKYFREVGYTHLYDCANAVDAEQGLRAHAEARRVRDLRDNEMIDGKASLARADECKSAFTPARWDSFSHDVAWFRDHAAPDAWDRVLRDHGYNASPAWAMLGSPIANLAPASRGFVGYADSMTSGALALIDPALVAIAFAAIAWAFGWRVACLGAVVFGCNPLSSFLWTGGAYMRQDCFALLLVGVACLKKRHFALGGALLAYASLLRVFPACLLLVIALRLAWTVWREHRTDRDLARVVAGAVSASLVIVVVSSAVGGGFHAWTGFAHNTAKLANSPSMNLVGLRTLLSFRPSTRVDMLFDASAFDPYARIVSARRTNFAHALPLFVIALIACLGLMVRVVRRERRAWVLACVGIAVIPIATELSCYYSSFLVGAALLHRERPRISVLLAAACAVLLTLHLDLDNDVLYACASAALVLFAVWALWECGNPARARRMEPASAWPHARTLGSAVCAVVIGVGLVVLAACSSRDVLMNEDAACEARWAEVADAFRARADVISEIVKEPGERSGVEVDAATTAHRRAVSSRLAGDEFTDQTKLDAFERAQDESRRTMARIASPRDDAAFSHADQRIASACAGYDDSVRAFNAVLAHAPRSALNRANGRAFEPRCTFGSK